MSSTPVSSRAMPPVPSQAGRHDRARRRDELEMPIHLEKVTIEQLLDATQGNKAEAARILRIDYKTLYRKMHRHFGAFSDIDVAPEEDHSA